MKKLFSIPFFDSPLPCVGKEILEGSYLGKVVVTPNVDHIVRYHYDPDFEVVYSSADLYLNDSRILRVLSKIGLCSLENVIPGSDLTKYLIEKVSANGGDVNVCVVGAKPDDVQILRSKYGLKSVYHYVPPMGFVNDEMEITKCLDYFRSLPACIYFISVGSPQQEVLAVRMRDAGIKGTFMCVGASVLFLSGRERRAPKLVQIIHLEWLYRLCLSPKRLFRRYLVSGPRIFSIFWNELLNRDR